MKLPSPEILLT